MIDVEIHYLVPMRDVLNLIPVVRDRMFITWTAVLGDIVGSALTAQAASECVVMMWITDRARRASDIDDPVPEMN